MTPPPDQQPSFVHMASRGVWRVKYFVAGWAVLAAGVAFVVGKKLGQENYRAEGQLQYTPAMVASGNKILYRPPALASIKEFITSAPVLERVQEDVGAPIPVPALRAGVTVDTPRESETLTLTYTGPNPEFAEKILASLMRSAADAHAEDRRARLAEMTERHRESVTAAEAAVTEAHEAFRDRLTADGLDAAPVRLREAARAEIGRIKANLRQKEGELGLLRGRIQQKTELLRAARADADDPQLREVIANRRAREAGIEKELREERARLADASREYATGYQLMLRNAKPKNEVKALETQVKTHRENVAALEKTLKRVKKDHAEPPVSPRVRKLQDDLEEIQGLEKLQDQAVAGLKLEQSGLERRVAALTQAQAKYRPWTAAVDQATDRLERLKAALDVLNQQRLAAGELTVQSPATADPVPAGSSRFKYTAAAFAGLLSLAIVGAVFREAWRFRRSMRGACYLAGLPVLADYATDAAARDGQTRALALRVCQRMPEPGSVLLLAPATPDLKCDQLASELGGFLARHQERVLILDMSLDDSQFSILMARQGAGDQVAIFGGPSGEDDTSPGSPSGNTPASLGPPPEDIEDVQLFDANPLPSEPRPDVGEDSTSRLLSHRLEGGFLEYLRQADCTAVELAFSTQVAGVDYLPAGSAARLGGVLALHKMRAVLAELRRRYTFVLMLGPADAEPLDLETLATLAQGAVLVGPPELVSPSRVGLSARFIAAADAPVLGGVVYQPSPAADFPPRSVPETQLMQRLEY